ncbi:MAG: hypothetical protein ABJF10_25890 [Chthoniobacter sp.]|uniref:hypothetical protein n=1 Tax=Chthoniobacter sp. TaxID=2510640 RepID=UPI0032ABD298
MSPETGSRMADQKNPIYDAATTKPEPYKAVRLYFSDGSRKGGIWTGTVWWSEGCAVYPEHWQRLLTSESQRPEH